jgi:hypothetical protein
MSKSNSIKSSYIHVHPYVNTYFDYLPKEIINIIYEYNADHRPIFNKVLRELIIELFKRRVNKLKKIIEYHGLILSKISQILDIIEIRFTHHTQFINNF